MFKIFATICFLSIGATETTLCFKSEVPMNFKTDVECVLARDNIVNYMHEDLVERDTTILFECREKVETIDL
tara:strand:- start:2449 stop:2664 length:216 start_codon:yes stop_codon:yes gene_type:complete